MLKNIYGMVLNSNENVDLYCSIAAKYDLLCLHKIGVYGKFEQHELQIIGKRRNYKRFISEINNLKDDKEES